jgi:hypothetical protein
MSGLAHHVFSAVDVAFSANVTRPQLAGLISPFFVFTIGEFTIFNSLAKSFAQLTFAFIFFHERVSSI